MSRSPSPASSLDFISSSGSEEEEYRPQKKRGTAAASSSRKGPTIKINMRGLKSAQNAAALHPMDGDVEEEEYESRAVVGMRGVDLSDQDLVRDHELRPLWVDETGNMSVLAH